MGDSSRFWRAAGMRRGGPAGPFCTGCSPPRFRRAGLRRLKTPMRSVSGGARFVSSGGVVRLVSDSTQLASLGGRGDCAAPFPAAHGSRLIRMWWRSCFRWCAVCADSNAVRSFLGQRTSRGGGGLFPAAHGPPAASRMWCGLLSGGVQLASPGRLRDPVSDRARSASNSNVVRSVVRRGPTACRSL